LYPVAYSLAAPAQDQAAGWIEEDTDVADRAVQEASDSVNAQSLGKDGLSANQSTTDKKPTETTAGAKPMHPTHKDDLQTIDGIGPGLHSRLQEYGILTYTDLAQLDDEGAIKLGTHLELDAPEVVIDWSAQAKEHLS